MRQRNLFTKQKQTQISKKKKKNLCLSKEKHGGREGGEGGPGFNTNTHTLLYIK